MLSGKVSLVQKSHIVCGVSECDGEAAIMRRLWPAGGCCAMGGGGISERCTRKRNGTPTKYCRITKRKETTLDRPRRRWERDITTDLKGVWTGCKQLKIEPIGGCLKCQYFRGFEKDGEFLKFYNFKA